MGFLVPTPEQQARQHDRFVRITNLQATYLMPVLAILCAVGVAFFPEAEMKWLCAGLIVLVIAVTILLHKVLLPRLRRNSEKLWAACEAQPAR